MDVGPTPITLEHAGRRFTGTWSVRDSWITVRIDGREISRLIFSFQHHLEELAMAMMTSMIMGWATERIDVQRLPPEGRP